MADIIRIQDLNANELTNLLAAEAGPLSQDQAPAVQGSADSIRTIKHACDTLQMLEKLREAA
jgi:hypothetical protein